MSEPERTVPDDERWVRTLFRAGEKKFTAHARVQHVDGVAQVVDLVISGVGIDAQALRSLSPAQMIATATMALPPELRDRKRTPAESRRIAAVDRKLTELRAALASVWEHEPAPALSTPREPLSRPDGTDPAGFSRRVAAAYREAASASSTPAKVLAEEAGVPVTTVHRWVRDARRLGLLPAARKGSAR